MTNRDIGSRVHAVRQGRKMTTTDLARRVGISHAQISRLENGLQGFRPSAGSPRQAQAVSLSNGASRRPQRDAAQDCESPGEAALLLHDER